MVFIFFSLVALVSFVSFHYDVQLFTPLVTWYIVEELELELVLVVRSYDMVVVRCILALVGLLLRLRPSVEVRM